MKTIANTMKYVVSILPLLYVITLIDELPNVRAFSVQGKHTWNKHAFICNRGHDNNGGMLASKIGSRNVDMDVVSSPKSVIHPSSHSPLFISKKSKVCNKYSKNFEIFFQRKKEWKFLAKKSLAGAIALSSALMWRSKVPPSHAAVTFKSPTRSSSEYEYKKSSNKSILCPKTISVLGVVGTGAVVVTIAQNKKSSSVAVDGNSDIESQEEKKFHEIMAVEEPPLTSNTENEVVQEKTKKIDDVTKMEASKSKINALLEKLKEDKLNATVEGYQEGEIENVTNEDIVNNLESDSTDSNIMEVNLKEEATQSIETEQLVSDKVDGVESKVDDSMEVKAEEEETSQSIDTEQLITDKVDSVGPKQVDDSKTKEEELKSSENIEISSEQVDGELDLDVEPEDPVDKVENVVDDVIGNEVKQVSEATYLDKLVESEEYMENMVNVKAKANISLTKFTKIRDTMIHRLRDEKSMEEEKSETEILAEYAKIEDDGDRAFQILVDLGMININPDPDDPSYDDSNDKELAPENKRM
mmetsp:Transcript_12965/g.18514  ORF Transcript_12965/g.18514 Transcript_12965/m.18514 type:complete len:528 (-) Transcript_12965:52-1635(-)